VISLHAWPGGLAVAVEGPSRRAAAIFGPDGWRRVEPAQFFAEPLPSGTATERLAAPGWLTDQIAPMDLALGGVHTEFVRLDRLLGRLRSQDANGVVAVLGARSSLILLSDGRMQVLLPRIPPDAPPLPFLAGMEGWILVFAGRVAVPAEEAAASLEPPAGAPEPEPVAAEMPAGLPEPARVALGAGGERFVAASSVVARVPAAVHAEIVAAAGDAGPAVIRYLDGSCTTAEIAAAVGLSSDQVAAVIRLLVGRRLAFRYVTRVRPAGNARSPR
jgi:hypothetical protein